MPIKKREFKKKTPEIALSRSWVSQEPVFLTHTNKAQY